MSENQTGLLNQNQTHKYANLELKNMREDVEKNDTYNGYSSIEGHQQVVFAERKQKNYVQLEDEQIPSKSQETNYQQFPQQMHPSNYPSLNGQFQSAYQPQNNQFQSFYNNQNNQLQSNFVKPQQQFLTFQQQQQQLQMQQQQLNQFGSSYQPQYQVLKYGDPQYEQARKQILNPQQNPQITQSTFNPMSSTVQPQFQQQATLQQVCDFCTTPQLIPQNAKKFACYNCRNINIIRPETSKQQPEVNQNPQFQPQNQQQMQASYNSFYQQQQAKQPNFQNFQNTQNPQNPQNTQNFQNLNGQFQQSSTIGQSVDINPQNQYSQGISQENSKIYKMFICGKCSSNVIYEHGTSQYIQCGKCKTINKTPYSEKSELPSQQKQQVHQQETPSEERSAFDEKLAEIQGKKQNYPFLNQNNQLN